MGSVGKEKRSESPKGGWKARHGESMKEYRLLALLCLRYDRPLDRNWLAGTLWPDSSESGTLANLRNSLKDLRRALGTEAERLVTPTPRTLEEIRADAAWAAERSIDWTKALVSVVHVSLPR